MASFAAGKSGKKGEAADTTPRFGRVKANLKMGILGLPNVGKSSLFNLLTNQSIAAENYPFCTIEPNESRCPVPDKRFDFLCDLHKPPSKIGAFLNVTDIAGLIRGASTGAGLGNAFLSHIQAVDGLFHVVRAFDDPEVIHVDDSVDPLRDMETIVYELCRKDESVLEKVTEQGQTAIRKDPKKKFPDSYYTVLERAKEMLENNQPLRSGDWSIEEVARINEHLSNCITLKPIVYLVNLDRRSFVAKGNKWLPKISDWVKSHGGGTIIPLSVAWEQELWDLKQGGDEAATAAFLQETPGLKSVLPRIVKVGYNVLQLAYFFTAGETEVRAWTIPSGALAPEAAGAIHTDFQRGFIKAEVVAFDDFKELCGGKPSMGPIKAAGKYRQEGKQYVVKDGDIVHFMFNVTATKKK